MQQDFRHLAAQLTYLTPGDLHDVRRGYDLAAEAHAGQTREDGAPYISHCVAVAEIMAQWHGDRDALIAALLHDVLEDTRITKDTILEKFGRRVALLVEGMTKFSQADLSPDLPLERKVETLRKLFDVMRLDIRVALIKIADRLHNVRTINTLPTPERRRRFALETLNIYYKIAFHLGLRTVRRELAELCVPHAYDCGAEDLALRDKICEAEQDACASLQHDLKDANASNRILRVFQLPRNLLIFHTRRLERGGQSLPEDAYSINIIVREEDDCYYLLKILHTLYRPLSGRFRDFIAAPSDGGYRSLHTHVARHDGALIEIRIRTPDMEEQSEKGITRSLFGDAIPRESSHFAWLQKSESLDLQTRDSSSAFWEALESDILREAIAVTVDRRRLSLPIGSTVLDAAYAAYNERASHVKVLTQNGRVVTFGEPLEEDDEVHVTFGEAQQASFDWLQYVTTHHARFQIVDVLKKTSRSEKIRLGATLLQKELDHYNKGLISGFSRTQCQHVADHFKRETFDQVLAMVGEGVIRARDVVFYLYPDHQSQLAVRQKRTGKRYDFRLQITMHHREGGDPLSSVNGVMRLHDVRTTSINIRPAGHVDLVEILVSASAADRLQFADFIDSLERLEFVSSVQTLIPAFQKLILLTSIFAAFSVMILDFIFFPQYKAFVESLSVVPQFTIQALPLLPIFIVNFLLLRLLQQYVVRMRSDRWFLSIGIILNFVGLTILLFRMVQLEEVNSSLLPIIIIFVFSLVYMGYVFFQAEGLFSTLERRTAPVLSQADWQGLQRRKLIGYSIRFLAIIIWGLEPIYIRYTSVNLLSPFLRTFLLGIGVFVPSALFYFLRSFLSGKRSIPRIHLPYNSAFSLLIVGQIGYMYFKNASLMYTSGTNLLLFNNFAPVIGLLLAAFFWRSDIAYFRQPKTMLWIFLLSLTAGIGSSFLVYNNSVLMGSWSVLGDVLAMVSTFFDVLLTVGQIQYIKHFNRTDGILLNMHIFFFLLLFMAPVIIIGALMRAPLFIGLNGTTLLLGLGIGLFVGIGQYLNYEAFKRIDGYLAYMMFNLSILVTFIVEAFWLHSIQPTILLFISGILIIGSSIVAELVNARCQKRGF